MEKVAQNVLSYFAVFDPIERGGFNVFFPDFPGCVTFGKNMEEAKEKAAEVLGLWLEELASQKQKFSRKTLKPIISKVTVSVH